MANFEIICPRCVNELAFRARDGDELSCAECDLDFEIDGDDVLYDPAAARLRGVDFICPACREAQSIYASNGEEFDCECGQGLVVKRRRVFPTNVPSPGNNTKKLTAAQEKRALALVQTLKPTTESGAAIIAKRALTYLGEFGGEPGQHLKIFLLRVGLVVRMVKDAVQGKADVPWNSIAALAGVLAYFVLPSDVIPDFIPFVGFIDDAFVMTLTLRLINGDVEAYARAKRISLGKYDI